MPAAPMPFRASRSAGINLLDHERFVRMFAARYAPPGAKRDDLIQEGWIGLMEALEHYDPERGFTFLNYAGFWIRKNILSALRNYDRPLSIPVNVHEWESLVRRKKIDPNNPTKRGKRNLGDGLRALNAHACRDGEDGVLLANLPDHRDRTPAEIALRRLFISQLLSVLPGRERLVVASQHGLDGRLPQTDGEIAAGLGITPQRVRQIALSAYRRMRLYAWRDTGGARTANDTPMRERA